MQHYIMWALAAAPPLEQLCMSGRGLQMPSDHMVPLLCLLTGAVRAGEVSRARLIELLAHKSILEPLQEVAEGRASFWDVMAYLELLQATWAEFSETGWPRSISSASHAAAVQVVMAALRQGAISGRTAVRVCSMTGVLSVGAAAKQLLRRGSSSS